MGCPVRIDCLADALDSRTEFGVWGGMTERERRTLLRRRPDVASWRAFFQSQQDTDQYHSTPRSPLRQMRRH
jgi:WhiB family redox-sensing transcriptional regulator